MTQMAFLVAKTVLKISLQQKVKSTTKVEPIHYLKVYSELWVIVKSKKEPLPIRV